MLQFDNRHRNHDGEISHKHGNTLIGTLRKIYGQSRYRRCASPIPKIQIGWGYVWADVLQISIRRDRLEWQDIALRR